MVYGVYIYIYLVFVVWNMAFMTFHSVGNVIIPTDELIFFRGVAIPPTRYIYIYEYLQCEAPQL